MWSRILVLASSTLLSTMHIFVHGSTIASLPNYLRVGFDCAQLAFDVLLPSGCGAKVVGLVMVEGKGLAVGFEESSGGGGFTSMY